MPRGSRSSSSAHPPSPRRRSRPSSTRATRSSASCRSRTARAGAARSRASHRSRSWRWRAGLPVLQPERLKDPAFLDAFAALRADLGVVAAYGRIIPEIVINTPRLGPDQRARIAAAPVSRGRADPAGGDGRRGRDRHHDHAHREGAGRRRDVREASRGRSRLTRPARMSSAISQRAGARLLVEVVRRDCCR